MHVKCLAGDHVLRNSGAMHVAVGIISFIMAGPTPRVGPDWDIFDRLTVTSGVKFLYSYFKKNSAALDPGIRFSCVQCVTNAGNLVCLVRISLGVF